jgi:hypothetical protein
MGKASTATRCTQVTLLRPDVGSQTIMLPEGATLADLLREAGAAIRSPNILIDGRPIEEIMILKAGMMITIQPEPPQAPREKDWRRTVGMFANDPTFDEFLAECRAIREADRKATLQQLDPELEDP